MNKEEQEKILAAIVFGLQKTRSVAAENEMEPPEKSYLFLRLALKMQDNGFTTTDLANLCQGLHYNPVLLASVQILGGVDIPTFMQVLGDWMD